MEIVSQWVSPVHHPSHRPTHQPTNQIKFQSKQARKSSEDKQVAGYAQVKKFGPGKLRVKKFGPKILFINLIAELDFFNFLSFLHLSQFFGPKPFRSKTYPAQTFSNRVYTMTCLSSELLRACFAKADPQPLTNWVARQTGKLTKNAWNFGFLISGSLIFLGLSLLSVNINVKIFFAFADFMKMALVQISPYQLVQGYLLISHSTYGLWLNEYFTILKSPILYSCVTKIPVYFVGLGRDICAGRWAGNGEHDIKSRGCFSK